ncbi:hypothetical protein M5K25_009250 [Dendrobium thyrsiflorum]|uniref:Uncharacterized protein n=1 Tax=Dendrobium thyrsiflorum TaxID=117978 RepID=A0ABD0V686_DENTH
MAGGKRSKHKNGSSSRSTVDPRFLNVEDQAAYKWYKSARLTHFKIINPRTLTYPDDVRSSQTMWTEKLAKFSFWTVLHVHKITFKPVQDRSSSLLFGGSRGIFIGISPRFAACFKRKQKELGSLPASEGSKRRGTKEDVTTRGMEHSITSSHYLPWIFSSTLKILGSIVAPEYKLRLGVKNSDVRRWFGGGKMLGGGLAERRASGGSPAERRASSVDLTERRALSRTSGFRWWSGRMSGLRWWSGRTSGLRWWSGRTSGLRWWFGGTPASGGGPTVVRQNSGGGQGGARRQERSPISLLIP